MSLGAWFILKKTIVGERKAQTRDARRFVHLFSFVAQCPALCRIILWCSCRVKQSSIVESGQSICFSVGKNKKQFEYVSIFFFCKIIDNRYKLLKIKMIKIYLFTIIFMVCEFFLIFAAKIMDARR